MRENRYPRMRWIYRAPKNMSERRQEALWNAWHDVAFESSKALISIANDNIQDGGTGIRERGVSRRLAEMARNLIATFGVRCDGKTSPFKFELPKKAAA